MRKESVMETGQIWMLMSTSMNRRFCLSEQEIRCTRETLRKGVLLSGSILSTLKRSSKSSLSIIVEFERNKLKWSLLVKIKLIISKENFQGSMQIASHREENPFNKKKGIKVYEKSNEKHDQQGKMDYKGITLREYFRLCEETISYEHMQSIQEEESSNKDDEKQTPEFGLKEAKEKNRQKIKTEITEEKKTFHLHAPTKKIGEANENEHRSFNRINISMEEANILATCKKEKKQQSKNKRVATFPAKIPGEEFNKTSSGSFYYINEKKDKFLQKIKAEKERINSMKLNEAMLVTKYAAKFKINARDLIK